MRNKVRNFSFIDCYIVLLLKTMFLHKVYIVGGYERSIKAYYPIIIMMLLYRALIYRFCPSTSHRTITSSRVQQLVRNANVPIHDSLGLINLRYLSASNSIKFCADL